MLCSCGLLWYIQLSLPFAGAEKELGRRCMRSFSPSRSSLTPYQEDSQAEAGRRDEAAGARHWCPRKAQSHLYC